MKQYKRGYTQLEYTPWLKKFTLKDESALSAMDASDYFNRQDVREALHIPHTIQAWHGCAGTVHFNYQCLEEGSFWIYPILKNKIRMLIVSGDTDGAVPYIGTIKWISELKWKKSEDRR